MRRAEGLPGRGAAFKRDWTKGSIIRNLLLLSWPVIVSSSLNMIGPTVDMVWVGKLGSTSGAGEGVAGITVMLANAMMMGLFVGLQALVARSVGAGDEAGAVHVARQAVVFSIALSLIMAALGIFLAEEIMRLTGVEAEVVVQGGAYLRILFVGMLATSFGTMSYSIMQASGDTMTPMKIAVAYRLFHVGLCPFLVFGWWIFPRLEVSGAALTQVISQALGAAVALWFLFTGRSRLKLTFNNFHFAPGVIWRLLKVGIPASVMSMQQSVGQFVWMLFMIQYGTLAVAAHTVVNRIENFIYMPVVGFGMAAGVLAAQNLGAKQPARAEKTGWLAVGIVESFTVLAALALFLWAESLVRIFNVEPGLVKLASSFLRIASAGCLVIGFAAVLQNFISGVGDTLPPMVVGLVMMWGVQVPLAFLLPHVTDLGVYGLRWAMVAAIVVGGIVFTTYFRIGRWKYRKV